MQGNVLCPTLEVSLLARQSLPTRIVAYVSFELTLDIALFPNSPGTVAEPSTLAQWPSG